jgi:hypothetical protein
MADDTFSKACSGQTPITFIGIEISDDFRISNLGKYHLSMILLGITNVPQMK